MPSKNKKILPQAGPGTIASTPMHSKSMQTLMFCNNAFVLRSTKSALLKSVDNSLNRIKVCNY
jgi:hypothetical protein